MHAIEAAWGGRAWGAAGVPGCAHECRPPVVRTLVCSQRRVRGDGPQARADRRHAGLHPVVGACRRSCETGVGVEEVLDDQLAHGSAAQRGTFGSRRQPANGATAWAPRWSPSGRRLRPRAASSITDGILDAAPRCLLLLLAVRAQHRVQHPQQEHLQVSKARDGREPRGDCRRAQRTRRRESIATPSFPRMLLRGTTGTFPTPTQCRRCTWWSASSTAWPSTPSASRAPRSAG